MQLYLAHKHIWNDVDLFASNLLVMVPGITDDSFNDFDATTAVVDRFNHTIQGIPATAGQLHTVSFSTEADFDNLFARVNLDIVTALTTTFLRLTRPVVELVVEDFDNVFSDDTAIPGWDVTTTSSITAPDNTTFKSDSTKKEDGVFSAKFEIDQQMSVQSTKEFDETEDWTEFNIIEAAIETLTLSHGQIRMQILGPRTGATEPFPVLDDFLLLSANETTKGFKTVTRDISTIDRSSVGGVRIYTDTSLGWDPASPITLNIDAIRVSNTLFHDPAGYVRIRLQTPQKSNWAAISWDADLNGGSVSARARTASSFAALDQSLAITFGDPVTVPGGDPGVDDNTNIEIELAVTSNADKTASPIVRSITVSFITPSESEGITIDSADDFDLADRFANTKVLRFPGQLTDSGDEEGSVIIDGRVDVGDVTYGLANSLQQATFEITPIPTLGLTGSDLFTSPWQAATKDLFERFVSRPRGLDGVAHVSRLDDRTYLLCDTLNDRILLMNTSGEVVRGLVSNNVRNESDLYPLTSIFNKRLKTIYVAWSKNVSTVAGLDLTKFHVNAPGLSLTLSPTIDTVSSISGLPGDQGSVSANVTAILLGDTHFAEIEAYLLTQGDDAPLFLDIEPDAIEDGIDVDNANFSTLAGPRGIDLPVTDVIFVPGIFRPITAILSQFSDNWIVGNAKPLTTNDDGADVVTGVSPEEISSVVEYDPNVGETLFSADAVDFSTITFGGIAEFNERYLVVAGINLDESPPLNTAESSVAITQGLGTGTTTVEQTTTKTEESTDASGDTSETSTTIATDFAAIAKFRGRVKIIEKSSGRVIFDQFTSDGTFGTDVQVDADQQLLIVERFFEDNPESPFPVSRGRVVKMDNDGNVFWQYGLGSFEGFNDARVLDSGNIITSS
jgi:hypothetical protein